MYESLPEAALFAVKFHDGTGQWPRGWPSEENPLASGAAPPAGYETRTGAELNDIRRVLHLEFMKSHTKVREARELADVRRATDIETAANIAGGFEWPAGSEQRFSLSMAAQLNNLHDAAGPFPVTRATLDGAIVRLDEKRFRAFCAAARSEVRAHLTAGHEAQTRLAKGGPL